MKLDATGNALLALVFLGLSAGTATAVPSLQLNITDGTYDTTTQTVVFTAGSNATVNAYLAVNNQNSLTDSYGLSIALTPPTDTAGDYGSFVLNGQTIAVTADMVFGAPPLESTVTQLYDPGDLPSHDIFDTYFYELLFAFDPGLQTGLVNTQDTPGYDPTDPGNAGTDLYYRQFSIDTTNLAAGLGLHFDLYNIELVDCGKNPNCLPGDVDQSAFAPFSHDAEWAPGPAGGPGVPVPAPLALLGLGGILLGRRRRSARRL